MKEKCTIVTFFVSGTICLGLALGLGFGLSTIDITTTTTDLTSTLSTTTESAANEPVLTQNGPIRGLRFDPTNPLTWSNFTIEMSCNLYERKKVSNHSD